MSTHDGLTQPERYRATRKDLVAAGVPERAIAPGGSAWDCLVLWQPASLRVGHEPVYAYGAQAALPDESYTGWFYRGVSRTADGLWQVARPDGSNRATAAANIIAMLDFV